MMLMGIPADDVDDVHVVDRKIGWHVIASDKLFTRHVEQSCLSAPELIHQHSAVSATSFGVNIVHQAVAVLFFVCLAQFLWQTRQSRDETKN